MADIKWNAFTNVGDLATGDTIVGLRSGANVQFTAPVFSANQTWTPVFTFVTAGDLSVSYATQFGYYSRIGNMVFVNWALTCTPTYTTASGNMHITGLPFTMNNSTSNISLGSGYVGDVLFGTGQTMLIYAVSGNTSYIEVLASGNSTNPAILTTANLLSGQSVLFNGSVAYPV